MIIVFHEGLVIQKVVVDKLSGRSRGYGFITFADKKAMEEAIEEMNGIDLDGRTITVEKAHPHQGSGSDYGGGRGSDGGGSCFKCGKPGHFARECPSSEVSRGGGGRYGGRDDKYSGGEDYFKCGKPGHFARDRSILVVKFPEVAAAGVVIGMISTVEEEEVVVVAAGILVLVIVQALEAIVLVVTALVHMSVGRQEVTVLNRIMLWGHIKFPQVYVTVLFTTVCWVLAEFC
ncbi:uncharacterized protein LOC112181472 isoform X2 [Rosa chinensis]|uniref:uncharacterized protein LOC112181472 isoform X2 n=1 Tax=Rosa chinensis TaxID=74649 RepID=UPI000D089A3E|nr:uncharacterized protein LOC112181472 isoform X2 [Rosa chinensis]